MSLPPGWRLTRVAVTGSTNADLIAAARDGAAEGLALLADAQTAGRGRAERTWHSPSGNLHLSVLLRPGGKAERVGQIGILAALAVADLLDALGVAVRLKWPNDVLVDGAKIAGVLVEGAVDGEALAWAVVGIGLNVATAPADLPATALARHGVYASAPDLAPALLGALAARYAAWRDGGFATARAAWRVLGPAEGAPVAVRVGATHLSGAFHDLDPAGALVLVAEGRHRTISAGEVVTAAA
jgi:BirA family biotin operon repressor/biotin-[acetyl-CoA-carboxylase] ligase